MTEGSQRSRGSRPPAALPIDDVLGDVVSSVLDAGATVLVAPPGAGKTSRVPPAIADRVEGRVIVLEPRRIAARAAARRVAAERGWKVGEEVGYQVRFDRKWGPKTRVLFCTEGVLLARLQADPFLEGDACIVFDEFHERSLDADLALAMAARVRSEVRDDLGVLVMSATLDPEPIARFLGGAPVVESEGRAHPVEVTFLPAERARAGTWTGGGGPGGAGERLEDHVARAVGTALERSEGDVLVFLAGVGEIRRCQERLSARRDVDVLPLYGDLSPSEQDAALNTGPRRRVVLATNVAESSVTVGGVRAVVDSGEARVLRHDAASGVDRLAVERIDRAAADQRAGRAGRLGPGLCIRLWSAVDDRALESFLVPEVRRLDIAGPALQLAGWGEADLTAFPWFERPRGDALERATQLLARLGATDRGGKVTDLGRRLLGMPLHPRLAALVEASAPYRSLGALAAALLSERDPFRRGGPGATAKRDAVESDVLARCVALQDFADGRRVDSLAPAAAKQVLRVRDQIERSAKQRGGGTGEGDDDAETILARALLAAFPDRLCRRRPEDPERALMVGGKGVRMGRASGVTEAELFVAIRLASGRRPGDEDFVELASGVQQEWVDGGQVRVSTQPVFDARNERVVGRRREMLGELVLSEADHPIGNAADAEEVLVEAARRDPVRALGLDREGPSAILERIRFLRAHRADLELPDPTPEAFAELLPMLVGGCRSFRDLAGRPALDVFLGSLDHRQRQAIDREAPERIQVPSGSNIRLTYDGERPPVLAVRIQEMFGLAETPKVAGGRVAVLLHLLAPNGRPQQVTDDLASFWADAYHHVRKDLRGRYPRHPWPEDPLTEPPTRRTKRRR